MWEQGPVPIMCFYGLRLQVRPTAKNIFSTIYLSKIGWAVFVTISGARSNTNRDAADFLQTG